MDPRLLLVKAITLLYRESLLTERTENSSDLVRTVLEGIKVPETSLSINHDREMLMALKETALYMCSNSLDVTYEKEDILQRLKVNCVNDEKIYEAFAQGIEKDMDEGSLKRTILSIRKFINDTFRENEIIKIVREASSKISFGRDKIKNMRNFVNELCTKLEPYQIESSRKDPAIITSVDIGDEGSLNEAFNEIKDMDDAVTLLKTGWKGLNRMLQGGFRRGEQVMLAALQHNYKTGFTLTLFKQLAIYNTPVMINPTKKPLLVRISFEDSIASNLQFLYENLYENEHKKKPNLKEITPGEMAAYVKEKLQVNGYHIKMLRVDPSGWTYKDLQNYILELEANGYEIHACIVDYLPMIPTTGCEDGPMGHALRDLYRRTRNFFSCRKILFVTPHQLSPDAKQLVRDGHQNFVKILPGRGYTSGSKQIDQEIDLGIYIHIEKLNGQAYLTLQRDKHRGVGIISDEEKYMVLPFPKKSSIPDDFNSSEITCKTVGGASIGSGHGDEVPFWENETIK